MQPGVEDLSRMTRWARGDESAPHKPLLVLLALGRTIRGEGRLISFADIEAPLGQLIRDFGPSRQRVHPEYPFWRLQNDGFWEVLDAHTFDSRKSNTDPPISELRSRNATGGFVVDLYQQLRADEAIALDCAAGLAVRFFPHRETEVLDAVEIHR